MYNPHFIRPTNATICISQKENVDYVLLSFEITNKEFGELLHHGRLHYTGLGTSTFTAVHTENNRMTNK